MVVVDFNNEQEMFTSSNDYEIEIDFSSSGMLQSNVSFHGKDRSQHWDINMPKVNLSDQITQSEDVSEMVIESEYDTQIKKVFSIELKKTITIHVVERSDHCLFDCDDLDIYEAGEDFHDAMMNFCQFFSSDLEHFQSVKDEELTKDAKILKEKYLSYV